MIRNASEPQTLMGIALVGNPGSGKSTILNGIVGQKAFKSGLSLGTGLTSVLQPYEINGMLLFDTPGLADIEKKKQAGKELDRMLCEAVPVKIAFVVTLDAGRVRPDDAMTIDLVLSAIQGVDTNDKFGIIINQVSKGVAEMIQNNPQGMAVMRNQLTGNRNTSHWCQVPLDPSLADVSNGILMTAELTRFFAGLPETKPREAEVLPIDTADMNTKMEEQSRLIAEMEEANAETKRKMLEQLQKEEEKANVRSQRFQATVENLRLDHDRRIREMEAESAKMSEELQKEKDKASARDNDTGILSVLSGVVIPATVATVDGMLGGPAGKIIAGLAKLFP